jgi:hypothetical protein
MKEYITIFDKGARRVLNHKVTTDGKESEKKIKTGKGLRLKIVNPDAAGIDVSSREMQACVPLDRDPDYNRKFGVFTEDLESLCSWLSSCRVTTVAMESTGVYWVPL